MSFTNPYHSIPALQSLRVEQITCWVEGHYGPKYVGSAHRSPAGNSFSGWIESNTGQNFSVNWHNNQRNEHMEGTLYIDGVLCDTHIIPEARSFPEDKWSMANIGFAQISTYTRRNFMFAEACVMHDPMSETSSPANDVGTIKLEIRRINIARAESVKEDYTYTGETLTSKFFHEGSRESVPHHVKFSDEYVQPAARPIIVATLGSRIDQEPLYTFTFRYRPIEILLAGKLFLPQFREPPPVIRVITESSTNAYVGPSAAFRDLIKVEECPLPKPLSPPPAYEEVETPREKVKTRKVRRRHKIRVQVKEEEYDSDY